MDLCRRLRRGHPTHHAWCVTPEGTVVDPTWETQGEAYFGIAVPGDALWRHVLQTRSFGLLVEWWRPGVTERVALLARGGRPEGAGP